jgi:hypothetical protein
MLQAWDSPIPPPTFDCLVHDIFAKSPRPGERAKSSAWAKCLEVSRATAIKPDKQTSHRPRDVSTTRPRFHQLPNIAVAEN